MNIDNALAISALAKVLCDAIDCTKTSMGGGESQI